MRSKGLAAGARQLPLRHISIRVPWKDNGWDGRVCSKPSENAACLILRRIREKRDDDAEETVVGKSWQEIDQNLLPPCVGERGQFMAPFDIVRELTHPYSQTSKVHSHFAPTIYRYPSYSSACIPYNWMLQENALELAEKYALGLDMELEARAIELMGFKASWLQDKRNQLVMLDTFFSSVQPNKSLSFFYAKRTPIVDDTRRVLMGVGWVTHVGDAVEYQYKEKGELRSMLWERAIHHSVRPGFQNGFLFPYHEIIEYLKNNPNEDPEKFVVFVPDEEFEKFSYGSEHVTNDGAISVLLACSKVLERVKKVIAGNWDKQLDWIDSRLNELWKMRGPYPGFGSALTAFGFERGTLLALEIEMMLSESYDNEIRDPWLELDRMFREPEKHAISQRFKLSHALCEKWKKLPDERRSLLKLLSRFELTEDQAKRYYVHEDKTRRFLRIGFEDKELLENPYRIYELDRVAADPIRLSVIDRGIFPDEKTRRKFPLDKLRIDDSLDWRRVRAFCIQQLESATQKGHTLLPLETLICEVRDAEVKPECPIDSDLMTVIESKMSPVVYKIAMKGGQPAYQLERLYKMGEIIRNSVLKRLQGKRHEKDIDWRKELDTSLPSSSKQDALEEQARVEKTAALKELYSSRFSVLIGPAGTGKTTLLRILCNHADVKEGGILMLAPTGKARMRLQKQTGIHGALTIAQFLFKLDRYNAWTGSYRLSDREKVDQGKTVIVDEASMLTEEQLAAVLDALKGVERLILVGDPRQLPPIGAGRPFIDIVNYLSPPNLDSLKVRVAKGYAELMIRRRQQGALRPDLVLAEWFSGRPLDPGADEIWDAIKKDDVSKHLRFVEWNNEDELSEKILDVLVTELNLQGLDDEVGFEKSIGGSEYENRGVFFWQSRDGKPGASDKAEHWQILAPTKAAGHGVELINRLIQAHFRKTRKIDASKKPWARKIPEPMGREEILYGDKVINVMNQTRDDIFPKDGALQYVANGEIGIVVGQYKTKNFSKAPWKIEVEFSTQPGFKYGYSRYDFGEEKEAALELAYALTIHKAQGSEFGLTIIVLPNPCWLLSRELLYTALTRQQNRVVILHEGDRHRLKAYAEDFYSESAKRLTNLLEPPSPIEFKGAFMEERLIHRTLNGEGVRSKSEVIIANMLRLKGIEYIYERPLKGKDGSVRYPDFTIEDSESGRTIYWEHLGMMIDPEYRQRWEKKLEWYKAQGLRPLDERNSDGDLLITYDDKRGGVDSQKIDKLILGALSIP